MPIADIINAITTAVAVTAGIVEGAIDHQNRVDVLYNNVRSWWPKALAGLERTRNEYIDKRDTVRTVDRWLRNSSNLHNPLPAGCNKWTSAGASRGRDWPADCAFKDPWKANASKAGVRREEDVLDEIRSSRGPSYGQPLSAFDNASVAGKGNIRFYRDACRTFLAYWMGIELFRTPLALSQGLIISPIPPEALSERVLKLLWPNDPDAEAGRVPADLRHSMWNLMIEATGWGVIPPDYVIPGWIIGLTDAERRRISPMDLPTVRQVLILRQIWEQGLQTSMSGYAR